MPTFSAKLIFMLKSARFLQRSFAVQRGGQRKRNLKCFSVVMGALSGGDQVSLLRCFFSSREGRPLLEQLGLEPKDTSQRLVEGLLSLYASASSRKEKRAVLLVASLVFSRNKLWQKGFRFSSTTLTRARKSTQTGTSIDLSFQSVVSDAQSAVSNVQSAVLNAQSAVPNAQSAVLNAQPSPSAISSATSLALRWIEDHSREAANRTVTLKRKECNDPDCGADHNSKMRYVTMDG